MFNPQEIDFGEVERLREKVANFEKVMALKAADAPANVLFQAFLDQQEANRKDHAKVNQGLLEVISKLQTENKDLKDVILAQQVQS